VQADFSHPTTDASQFTYGQWNDERKDSAPAFDAFIERTGLFKIYSEVRGQILQPRLGQTDQGVRIDRILSPTKKLKDAGWATGFVGVELKRSGEKIGPPLAQLLDYGRAVWTLPGGYDVMCRFYFLWPVKKQHSTNASIMAQHRVGNVEAKTYRNPEWDRICFHCGEQMVLRHSYHDDRTEIGKLNFGNGAGSR
jgi:hypothetical protein